MKKQLFTFIMLLLLMMSSCLSESFLQQNLVREVDLKKITTDTLLANQLHVEIPGLLDVFCLEDVTLLRTRDPENLFYILDNNNHNIIGAYGRKGNGPTDFLYPRNFTPADSGSLWITDMGLKRMYHFAIANKESQKAEGSILSTLNFKDEVTEGSYVIDESKIFGIVNSVDDSTEFFLKDLSSTNEATTFRSLTFRLPKKYSEFTVDQKMEYAQKSTAIKPDRSKIALAHYFSPYISVISTDGTAQNTISIKQLDRNNEVSSGNFEQKLHAIFDGVAVTDNYIYVVHNSQLNEEVAEISKPVEILVFDWELNPVRKFFLNEYVLRIGVSLTDDFLIGVDYTNEKIFKYQLP